MCPRLGQEERNPQPARDEGGSKWNLVVEVEPLLSGRNLATILHDEFDQIGLVLLPKGIAQILEQLEESQSDRR